MQKFDISTYHRYSDLPLEEFQLLRYSIYVLDFDWNYLFVNDFARQNIGPRAQDLIGKNMWRVFSELQLDPSFKLLRDYTEKGIPANIVTVSPVTGQRLNIIGHKLQDCFFFSVSILPKKEEVLKTLRTALDK